MSFTRTPNKGAKVVVLVVEVVVVVVWRCCVGGGATNERGAHLGGCRVVGGVTAEHDPVRPRRLERVVEGLRTAALLKGQVLCLGEGGCVFFVGWRVGVTL